jgi:hypothetical protein
LAIGTVYRTPCCLCLTELNGMYVRAARCFQLGGRRSRRRGGGRRPFAARHACMHTRADRGLISHPVYAGCITYRFNGEQPGRGAPHTDHPCVMCPSDTLRLHGLLAPECQRDSVTADLVLLRPQAWCQLRNAFFASRESLDQYIGSHWTDRWRLSCTGPVCSEVLVTVASTSRCRSVRSRPFSL